MEKREKRDRERDLWEEERPELMTVRVWGEKKVRKITTRERRRQKIMFPTGIDKDNIYRKCNAWEKDCFPKKLLENNL